LIKEFDGTLIRNEDDTNGNEDIEIVGLEVNANGHNGFTIRMVGVKRLKITGCKLVNANQSSAVDDIAISVCGIPTGPVYAEDIWIENNYIEGFAYKGIAVGNYVKNAWVENNTVKNTRYLDTEYPSDGIYVWNPNGERIHVVDNKVVHSEFRALFIYGKAIDVRGNHLIESGDYLIWVEGGEHITIRDNYLYGGGILAGYGFSLDVKQGKHIVIEGNKIEKSYGHGLELGHHIGDVSGAAYIEDVIIRNNIIINPNEANTDYYHGIYVTTENKSDAYIRHVEIVGNVIRDVRDTHQMVCGICFPSQTGGSRDDILIKDNIIEGYTGDAIRILNPTTLRVKSDVAIFSGDGSTTQFKVEHGLAKAPSKIIVTPLSPDAKDFAYAEADDTYIYFNFSTAPPSGTDNVKLAWYAEV